MLFFIAALTVSVPFGRTEGGFVWVYTTRNYEGIVKLDFEHTDFVWASFDKLSNYKTIPGTFGLIKEASIL